MADPQDTIDAPKRAKAATPSDTGGLTENGAKPSGSGSTLKDHAQSLASEAGETARKVANQGKDKAAEALNSVAQMAEDAAQAVEDKVGPTYGEYARKASTAVKDVADALQSKDIDDLIADTREFVRRSPAVAIGAAAAVGFLLTRLIKVGASGDDTRA